jgi:hypothetical protein
MATVTLNLSTLLVGDHIFMWLKTLNGPEQDHSVMHYKIRKEESKELDINRKRIFVGRQRR